MNNIDVIISAYNWADALQKTLLGFTQQTYPYFRILIADDGSDSDTREVIKAFKKKHTIKIINPLKSVWSRKSHYRYLYRIFSRWTMKIKVREMSTVEWPRSPRADF
ncbi:MAG: glycosyltransferase [Desulfobacteraceae bacterium]|nr:glycosyltransferase [Desulfobacteraceae bacterium]